MSEIITGLAKAWNAGSGAALAEFYAEDAVFVDVLGRVHHGRDVIGIEHQAILDTVYRGSTLEMRLLVRREIAPGLVLLNTESTLTAPVGPRAGTTDAVQTILVRDGLIIASQNTVRVPREEFFPGGKQM